MSSSVVMSYFDLLPDDLLIIFLIENKLLYKVSKSFLTLYMKMLDALKSCDINPDIYFQLLNVDKYKIPQQIVDASNKSNICSFVIVNGKYEILTGKDTKNMLTSVNQSVNKVYFYRYDHIDEYPKHNFTYICKSKDLYTLIEHYDCEKWNKLTIYTGKSWRLLIDSYCKHAHGDQIFKGNIFSYLLFVNGYNIKLIRSNLSRNIEYFITFTRLLF